MASDDISPGISVFDLDHTLLNVNISYSYGSYLCREKIFSRVPFYLGVLAYFRHLFLGMPLRELHQRIFKLLFKGHYKEMISKQASLFLEKNLNSFLNDKAVKRLHEARKNGDYIVILSSSPDFLVQLVAEYFLADEWKSTIYEANSEGILSSISHVMDGEDKADYVVRLAKKLGIPLQKVVAFSDSHHDLPLLNKVGKAVGVMPNCILRKECLRKSWEIIK